jgi:hypothetical protein
MESNGISRELKKRSGTFVVVLAVVAFVVLVPAFLFAIRTGRENSHLKGYKKTSCILQSKTIEEGTCTYCHNGGCYDHPCQIPSYKVRQFNRIRVILRI